VFALVPCSFKYFLNRLYLSLLCFGGGGRLDILKDTAKDVALGTSKINYMDPRITVAWCKRVLFLLLFCLFDLLCQIRSVLRSVFHGLFFVAGWLSRCDLFALAGYSGLGVSAWADGVGRQNEVPIEKVFAKTLRDKFNWAMAVPSVWRFDLDWTPSHL
jgi:hypothetical protein